MLVIGTALAVHPFNMMVDMAPESAHLVLINKENTVVHGHHDFEKGANKLFLSGYCDETVTKLVKDVGWEQDLKNLIADYDQKFKGSKKEEEKKQ
jgi:NAD-dependent SIR2 family protein deacetylase